MSVLIDVASLDRIQPGTAVAVTVVEETTIAVFNVDGTLYALEDTCVRCGSSLAEGKLDGARVACSGCDWQYDVTTGCVNGIPALRIDTFAVTIVDARVMVDAALVPHTH
jgi:3-phenylpropionate/trans-cinnamate dioxygenase ferredoxin subunit